MALDPGTKRVGIAVSDELRMIATPLEFVPAHPFADLVARLQHLIQEKSVTLLLVGMPRNMDGSYGPSAQRVRDFIAALSAEIKIEFKTWDERLTTVQANRFLIEGNMRRSDRKQKVDQSAAAILLQSYLDSLGMSGAHTEA
jgi:putative Holliday junction resolvase